jgi:hypothetical protein
LTNLTWPPDLFFWAVLDGCGLKGNQALPEGLLPLLQEELPIAVDQVHAVCVPASDGRLLICAARREDLREASALELTPEEVPALIEPTPNPSTLNLLVGALEPEPLRRERARRRTITALTMAALACVAAAGLSRRATAWTKAGNEARADVSGLAKSPTTLHLELERLRKTPRIEVKPTPDAAQALAGLLSGWPKELQCQTESVTVNPTTITLSLTVGKDARPLLAALKAPEGWTLEEPRLTAVLDGARLNVVLRRKEARS